MGYLDQRWKEKFSLSLPLESSEKWWEITGSECREGPAGSIVDCITAGGDLERCSFCCHFSIANHFLLFIIALRPAFSQDIWFKFF